MDIKWKSNENRKYCSEKSFIFLWHQFFPHYSTFCIFTQWRNRERINDSTLLLIALELQISQAAAGAMLHCTQTNWQRRSAVSLHAALFSLLSNWSAAGIQEMLQTKRTWLRHSLPSPNKIRLKALSRKRNDFYSVQKSLFTFQTQAVTRVSSCLSLQAT